MEISFTHNVYLREASARRVGEEARRRDVYLSCHAPYYINLSSEKGAVREKSVRWLVKTARIGSLLGAREIVFHPGYYRKDGETLETVARGIERVMEAVEGGVYLSPETTGRRSQFGTLEETLEVCQMCGVRPTVDFSHLHARTGGGLQDCEDYRQVFLRVEEVLGSQAMRELHIHFTALHFENRDEKHHCVLGECLGPDFRPLARLIAEMELTPTVVSESPILDVDALKMKGIFEEEKKKLEGKTGG